MLSAPPSRREPSRRESWAERSWHLDRYGSSPLLLLLLLQQVTEIYLPLPHSSLPHVHRTHTGSLKRRASFRHCYRNHSMGRWRMQQKREANHEAQIHSDGACSAQPSLTHTLTHLKASHGKAHTHRLQYEKLVSERRKHCSGPLHTEPSTQMQIWQIWPRCTTPWNEVTSSEWLKAQIHNSTTQSEVQQGYPNTLTPPVRSNTNTIKFINIPRECTTLGLT